MKNIILIVILAIVSIDAHSKILLKRYYTYYKLGYEYSKSILSDLNNNNELALQKTKEMCIETVGSPYMDSKYSGSCIFGAKDAMSGKSKTDLDTFLNGYIHEKF